MLLFCLTDHSVSGMRIEYLPSYSLDLNPIEFAFLLLKHKLHHHLPQSGSDFAIQEYLYTQTFSIPISDCRAFYHQCGYL